MPTSKQRKISKLDKKENRFILAEYKAFGWLIIVGDIRRTSNCLMLTRSAETVRRAIVRGHMSLFLVRLSLKVRSKTYRFSKTIPQ